VSAALSPAQYADLAEMEALVAVVGPAGARGLDDRLLEIVAAAARDILVRC
jgi:hypothetical protein